MRIPYHTMLPQPNNFTLRHVSASLTATTLIGTSSTQHILTGLILCLLVVVLTDITILEPLQVSYRFHSPHQCCNHLCFYDLLSNNNSNLGISYFSLHDYKRVKSACHTLNLSRIDTYFRSVQSLHIIGQCQHVPTLLLGFLPNLGDST